MLHFYVLRGEIPIFFTRIDVEQVQWLGGPIYICKLDQRYDGTCFVTQNNPRANIWYNFTSVNPSDFLLGTVGIYRVQLETIHNLLMLLLNISMKHCVNGMEILWHKYIISHSPS